MFIICALSLRCSCVFLSYQTKWSHKRDDKRYHTNFHFNQPTNRNSIFIENPFYWQMAVAITEIKNFNIYSRSFVYLRLFQCLHITTAKIWAKNKTYFIHTVCEVRQNLFSWVSKFRVFFLCLFWFDFSAKLRAKINIYSNEIYTLKARHKSK